MLRSLSHIVTHGTWHLDRIKVSVGLDRTWKEEVVAYFNVVLRYVICAAVCALPWGVLQM